MFKKKLILFIYLSGDDDDEEVIPEEIRKILRCTWQQQRNWQV
mgnify:CR=1 FL=1